MLSRINIFAICASIILYFPWASANTCINKDPCLCKISETSYIDISSVLEKESEVHDKEVNTYTFYGCKNTDVLSKINGNKTTVIGKAEEMQFATDNNLYLLTFLKNGTINATIILLCEPLVPPFFKILEENNQKFLLGSPKVCIITEEDNGMSGGSIFLLIFFIVASVYFVGGALLLYFVRGAKGVEMIPNLDFWKNVPGLVKDGLVFLLSGCKTNFVTTAETYDRI